jgi:hypothetical protein
MREEHADISSRQPLQPQPLKTLALRQNKRAAGS